MTDNPKTSSSGAVERLTWFADQCEQHPKVVIEDPGFLARSIRTLLAEREGMLEAIHNAVSLWAFSCTDEPQRVWLEQARAFITPDGGVRLMEDKRVSGPTEGPEPGRSGRSQEAPSQRKCAWCRRPIHSVVSCRRHRQCTEAVRAERKRLWPLAGRPLGAEDPAPDAATRASASEGIAPSNPPGVPQ